MRALVTTMTGWRSTARSVRWAPVLVTPLALCAALVVVGAVASPAPRNMSLLGEAGLAFTAAAVAFIGDDPTLEAAPATPIEARARLVTRATLAVPVVVAGWLLVLVVYDSLTPVSVTAERADLALAGLGVGAAALALAAVGGRLRSVQSPGAAGTGAMACLAVTARSLPPAWLENLPPARVLWPTTILVAVVTVAAATREPTG